MFGLINRGALPQVVEHELENFTVQLKSLWLREHKEDGTHNFVSLSLNAVPVGATVEWPTATAPSGWLKCDGAQYSRTTYKTLFDLIGTTFGAGDGSTTFNVPNVASSYAGYILVIFANVTP